MAIDKLRSFFDHSPLRRMGYDALVTASSSFVVRLAGFLKEIAVAASFGLSADLDVYLVAVVFIGLPVSILLNAAQPALITVVAGGFARDDRGLLVKCGSSALLCLMICLPLWLWALPALFPMLAAGFTIEKQEELRQALWYLTPYYFLNGVNLLGYGLLQARRRYLANGLIPIVTPVVTILFVLVAAEFPDWRVLVLALVAGTAMETLGLAVATMRRRQRQEAGDAPTGLRRVLEQTLFLLPGTVLVSVGPVIQQAIAASLGNGTNAALSYGYKLPSALTSITATAIGVTALPFFARLIAQREFEYCVHSLTRAAAWLVCLGIALVVVLAPFSEIIVELLYARGAFDGEAVDRVNPVQTAYLVQMPFAIVAILGVKTLSALGRNGLVSALMAFVVVLQSAAALALGSWLGAHGIAWAAVVGSFVLAASAYGCARYHARRLLR